MWIKIKEELFNLDLIRNISKDREKDLIFYYKIEMEQFEDYTRINFVSTQERDEVFKKIEKILGVENAI